VDSGEELHAPSIDSLTVTGRAAVPGFANDPALPGNVGAVLYLGEGSTDGSAQSIGSISVAGTLGDIQATGQIGSISAGAINGQLVASAFGSISAAGITGSIEATGTSGAAITVGPIFVAGDATSLALSSDQGSIAPITVQGRMVNCTIISAGAIQGISVGGGLDASRVQSLRRIGSISAGAFNDTDIQLGVAPSFTDVADVLGDFSNPDARLASFSAGEIGGNNNLSAPRLGALSLQNLADVSALQIYVIDTTSPVAASYLSAADPGSDFTWQEGEPVPPLLAEMLNWV
jgi:hypothetical protein